MTPDTLLAPCRFVHDATLMALWGASVYLWTLVPPSLAERTANRLNAVRLTAVVLTYQWSHRCRCRRQSSVTAGPMP